MLKIRPIVAEDYAAVRKLWRAAGLSVRPHGRDAQPQFLRQLAAFPTSYLLAECDEELVGVILGTHDLRRGWLNRIAVHPDHRRQGIARALITACEQALHAQGIGIIVSLVEEENTASAKLFADAGYSAQIPVRYFYKRTRPDI
jgi:ribosomal protein S18 acetylase RimI-like enzyme